ncbi:hypothetical protein JX265_001853 [Neoarthrinium moseri]|uniref:C2H2-type domain-containing protein n=1 Tax=Neoarthrinium moseri TaxID=1658444 RepID=A0A9Q0AU83_9PEZI|nr:hypothetical protein JX266_010330 [Neoarthrinium moseri]KAI1880232.1 hypothetical protein JX265_001853 [Neoarthrinium moseri]
MQACPGRKKVNHHSGEQEDGDQEEEESPRETRLSKGTEIVQLRMACPYFKYDARKYGDRQNCPGPGWKTVHRIKEHLYRRHRCPKYVCMRCGRSFGNEKDLEDHHQEDVPCSRQDLEPVDGFNDAQEALLRSRNKHYTGLPEYQKWKEVYKILFPHVEGKNIPNPFYEFDKIDHAQAQPKLSVEREAFLLRELPVRIKWTLAKELGLNLTAEDQLLNKTTTTLTTIVLETLNDSSQSSFLPNAQCTDTSSAVGGHCQDMSLENHRAQDIGDNVANESLWYWPTFDSDISYLVSTPQTLP